MMDLPPDITDAPLAEFDRQTQEIVVPDFTEQDIVRAIAAYQETSDPQEVPSMHYRRDGRIGLPRTLANVNQVVLGLGILERRSRSERLGDTEESRRFVNLALAIAKTTIASDPVLNDQFGATFNNIDSLKDLAKMQVGFLDPQFTKYSGL